ncbi:transposase [Bradyrhizobium diazoefficiens]
MIVRYCSKTAVERLKRHIRQKSDWQLYPCYSTEGVARLAAILGIPKTGDDFALQRGPDLLNRKSHFRQLATSVALPLPHGSVATDPNGLFKAVTSLKSETGRVIVKLDNGAGGVGNVILTSNKSDPLPGARDTRWVSWPSFDPEALWSEMTTASCKTLVVESYHLARSLFYLEYTIQDDASIAFVNSGSIRLRKSADRSERALIWTGLELPSDLEDEQLLAAQAHAYRFVALARDLGYRGMINIDAIFAQDGRLLFNEANGRWGGGSVLHNIAVRLLVPKPRPGKQPIYTKTTDKRILKLLDKPPPQGFARWTGPLLAEALGDVDVQYVWRFLRSHKIDLVARKSWCESNDPNFTAKAADVVGLYVAPPAKAIVLCVDEKPSIQALERAQGYLKLPNGRALTGQSHDYKRHGTTTLFAALEVATGKIIATHSKRRRRVEFLDFMNSVTAAFPNRKLHVILDNLNTHKKNEDWLKAHPNVQFHFTPTSASWLNQVEVWFSILQGQSLSGTSFTSLKQLQEHIDAYVNAYNDRAEPFVWTKKKVRQRRFKGRRITQL